MPLPNNAMPGWPAKYPAECQRCPDPIVRGQRVIYVGRGPMRLVHVACASGQDDE